MVDIYYEDNEQQFFFYDDNEQPVIVTSWQQQDQQFRFDEEYDWSEAHDQQPIIGAVQQQDYAQLAYTLEEDSFDWAEPGEEFYFNHFGNPSSDPPPADVDVDWSDSTDNLYLCEAYQQANVVTATTSVYDDDTLSIIESCEAEQGVMGAVDGYQQVDFVPSGPEDDSAVFFDDAVADQLFVCDGYQQGDTAGSATGLPSDDDFQHFNDDTPVVGIPESTYSQTDLPPGGAIFEDGWVFTDEAEPQLFVTDGVQQGDVIISPTLLEDDPFDWAEPVPDYQFDHFGNSDLGLNPEDVEFDWSYGDNDLIIADAFQQTDAVAVVPSAIEDAIFDWGDEAAAEQPTIQDGYQQVDNTSFLQMPQADADFDWAEPVPDYQFNHYTNQDAPAAFEESWNDEDVEHEEYDLWSTDPGPDLPVQLPYEYGDDEAVLFTQDDIDSDPIIDFDFIPTFPNAYEEAWQDEDIDEPFVLDETPVGPDFIPQLPANGPEDPWEFIDELPEDDYSEPVPLPIEGFAPTFDANWEWTAGDEAIDEAPYDEGNALSDDFIPVPNQLFEEAWDWTEQDDIDWASYDELDNNVDYIVVVMPGIPPITMTWLSASFTITTLSVKITWAPSE